jgi:hypothetical protein
MKISRKLIIGVFGLLIIAPFIFSSIVGYYFIFNQGIVSDTRAEDTIEATSRRLDLLYDELNSEIKIASKDIKFLSELSSIQALIEDDKKKALVKKDFLSYLNNDKTNYRLQYINQFGAAVVDIESLGKDQFREAESKNVKKQPYFEKILQLESGEMYISNVELDADGISLMPHSFIRIGIPITDTFGTKEGILMLSIPADSLFGEIGKCSRVEESVFLVNQQGDYLAHQDKTKEIYFSENKRSNLFNEYPQIKNNISIDFDRGVIKDKNNLFVYRIVYPTISLSEVYKGSEKVWGKNSEKSFYWILMSESSQAAASQESPLFTYLTFILVVGGGALLLIMLVFLIFLKISGSFFKENLK